jgi:hypothetical protein
MHAANEDQVRKVAHDVDRFIGVHRLRMLLDKKRIDETTFRINRNRMTGSNESVRRGLNNLTNSPVLSSAIAEVLQHEHLHSVFSAAAWKKLTTGRFYHVSRTLCYTSVVSDQRIDSLACLLDPY